MSSFYHTRVQILQTLFEKYFAEGAPELRPIRFREIVIQCKPLDLSPSGFLVTFTNCTVQQVQEMDLLYAQHVQANPPPAPAPEPVHKQLVQPARPAAQVQKQPVQKHVVQPQPVRVLAARSAEPAPVQEQEGGAPEAADRMASVTAGSGSIAFTCTSCNRVFGSQKALSGHMKSHRTEAVPVS